MISTLQPIAEGIVELSERRGLTPVIVTPRYLSLRPIFLVELCAALVAHTDRPLRIDWCRRVPSARTLVSDSLAAWHARRINRQLQPLRRQLGREIQMQVTASVTRPGGMHRHLVIGWCNESFELPSWTVPIQLSGQPLTLSAAA